MKPAMIATIVLVVALVTSCGSDARRGSDASLPPPEATATNFVQTAGGGAGASRSYRLELQIGVPQPRGTSSGANHEATMGPGKARQD